ncbi:GntR family transcriptional regulator [Propionibacteriaceae bacterium G57]|uniref:GntR family transcriptional regulator n=1 Tax=Aestuariimicrobium sp. G57 TaxID=3418485 RepID=UPI003DA77D93
MTSPVTNGVVTNAHFGWGGFGVTTTRDVAEHHLRQAILEGRLEPGERLNEVLIAEELGISRGPLREAIQRLASEGLLHQVRNKGAFVPLVDHAELGELYEARIALERRAVKLVARDLAAEHKSELSKMLDETTAALESGDSAAYPPDLDFHRALFAMADNATLTRFATEVQARIQLARARSARDHQRAIAALQEHRAIAQAVVDGDAELACDLMETHLYHSLKNAKLAL